MKRSVFCHDAKYGPGRGGSDGPNGTRNFGSSTTSFLVGSFGGWSNSTDEVAHIGPELRPRAAGFEEGKHPRPFSQSSGRAGWSPGPGFWWGPRPTDPTLGSNPSRIGAGRRWAQAHRPAILGKRVGERSNVLLMFFWCLKSSSHC